MTPFRIGRSARALILTSTAFVALASFAQNAQAATAAGTVIRNQATATYMDGGGNRYQAQSNIAEITVQKVYIATISHDRTKTGAAGQPVYSSHTLSNLGNSEAYYVIGAYDALAGFSPSHNDQKDDLTALLSVRVYHDLNGNGVADAGEPLLSTGGSAVAYSSPIRIEAGRDAQLVVEAQLPSTANSTQTYAAAVFARPSDAAGAFGAYGSVRDSSGPGDRHVQSVTNQTDIEAALGVGAGVNNTLINVTANAVLEITKEATLDATNLQIHYVTTIRNVGGVAARDVRIFDVLPANTTLTGVIESRGFGSQSGDVTAVATTIDENAAPSRDYNGDGVLSATATAVSGLDASIAPGVSVQLAFTVNYDPAVFPIGSKVTNIAYVHADVDGVTGRDGSPEPSNPATVTINAARYGVTIQDTGVGGDDALNNGGDDDNVQDGTQLVRAAAPGETVIFRNIVRNTGTTADSFNLTALTAGNTFPTGSVISFWNDGGAVQLLDTTNDGVPNTPIIAAGGSYTVEVRVTLPNTIPPAFSPPFSFTARAASATDSTQTATVTNTLESLTASKVDLVNSLPTAWSASTNLEAYDPNPANASPPITELQTNTGVAVSFPLYLQNQSGAQDSFQLYAGGGWYSGYADVLSRLRPLESGWTVRFYNQDGVEISTTPTLRPSEVFHYTARVTPPSNPWEAPLDYLEDVRSLASTAAGDGTPDLIGDSAYPFFFLVRSAISGVWDVKLDAVKLREQLQYALSASKQQQTILPGGYSRTDHTLKNTGNVEDAYTVTAVNPDSDWGVTVWYDTNGDGVPDTSAASLTPTTVVNGRNKDGDPITIPFNGTSFLLQPGDELPIWMDVYAPSNAAPDEVNIPVLQASDGATTQSASVPYRVSLGVLRLVKTAAVDATCDYIPDGAFSEVAAKVAPEQCAIWQVVGTNVGAQPVYTVNLSDAVPDFTRYVAGSTRFCPADAGLTAVPVPSTNCTLVTVPDASLNPAPASSGLGNIGLTLGVSVGSNEIPPGGAFTVRFSTRVD